jgi:hypothetical protein
MFVVDQRYSESLFQVLVPALDRVGSRVINWSGPTLCSPSFKRVEHLVRHELAAVVAKADPGVSET